MDGSIKLGLSVGKEETVEGVSVALLARRALEYRERAYVPYSGFGVGAALLSAQGEIFGGCNIENASFTPTNCAERTAIFKAVSEEHRQFAAIVVAGGPRGREPEDFCVPCGVCLQVMSEFCPPDFPVYLAKSETEIRKLALGDLLPMKFDSLEVPQT